MQKSRLSEITPMMYTLAVWGQYPVSICFLSFLQRRQWNPTPVFLPGKSHRWRNLVGCGPWGHEESDTAERLHFHFSLSCIGEGNGNPLQCSCPENPRDRGAWWTTVYGVTQSWTRLKWLSSSSSSRVSSGLTIGSGCSSLMAVRWKVIFVSFLSSHRTHQLTISGDCNHWWLRHPLFTDMEGNTAFLSSSTGYKIRPISGTYIRTNFCPTRLRGSSQIRWEFLLICHFRH